MLVIRFTRTGKRGERKYRIVVKERRSKRDGVAIDLLGHYEKTTSGVKITVDQEKLKYWKSNGAQLSDSVKQALTYVK